MYKQLNILKSSDIYHPELGKFICQLYSDRLPAVFAQLFKKIKKIHSQNTRQTEQSTYFFPRVSKTIGQQLLTFRGVKFWYSIDDQGCGVGVGVGLLRRLGSESEYFIRLRLLMSNFFTY